MVTSATLAKTRLGRQSPDERRENILAVAAEVFAHEGYGTASMSMIAARLGGSKATLYKYFTSKEELFQAVMQRKCEAVIGPLEEMADTSRNPTELLLAFGKVFLWRLCQHDALIINRTVHGEGQRFPEVAQAFFKYGPEAAYSVLVPAMTRFHAEGLVDCPDPRLAVEQFLAMVRGDVHMRVSCGLIPPPDEDEIERQVAHAVGIFVRGISRRDRPD
jgi:AcrR family transcriptional regulator